MTITVAKLKKMLDNFQDENIVTCGFEGLKIFKEMEDKRHSLVGQVDFENDKKRTQKILGERTIIESF